jgi:hypothetical protein
MNNKQNTNETTPHQRHSCGARLYLVSRIEQRETDQDIREALQSTSATSYVFQVQGYEWEVR